MPSTEITCRPENKRLFTESMCQRRVADLNESTSNPRVRFVASRDKASGKWCCCRMVDGRPFGWLQGKRAVDSALPESIMTHL